MRRKKDCLLQWVVLKQSFDKETLERDTHKIGRRNNDVRSAVGVNTVESKFVIVCTPANTNTIVKG